MLPNLFYSLGLKCGLDPGYLEYTASLTYSLSEYVRDANGRFASSQDISALKEKIKAKRRPKLNVESFIEKQPDGKSTRKMATDLAKPTRQMISNHESSSSKDLDDLFNHLNNLYSLKEYSDKRHNHLFYEIDEEVRDDEVPESWRYERASETLGKAYRLLENYLDEKEEILDKRYKRKLSQKPQP